VKEQCPEKTIITIVDASQDKHPFKNENAPSVVLYSKQIATKNGLLLINKKIPNASEWYKESGVNDKTIEFAATIVANLRILSGKTPPFGSDEIEKKIYPRIGNIENVHENLTETLHQYGFDLYYDEKSCNIYIIRPNENCKDNDLSILRLYDAFDDISWDYFGLNGGTSADDFKALQAFCNENEKFTEGCQQKCEEFQQKYPQRIGWLLCLPGNFSKDLFNECVIHHSCIRFCIGSHTANNTLEKLVEKLQNIPQKTTNQTNNYTAWNRYNESGLSKTPAQECGTLNTTFDHDIPNTTQEHITTIQHHDTSNTTKVHTSKTKEHETLNTTKEHSTSNTQEIIISKDTENSKKRNLTDSDKYDNNSTKKRKQ